MLWAEYRQGENIDENSNIRLIRAEGYDERMKDMPSGLISESRDLSPRETIKNTSRVQLLPSTVLKADPSPPDPEHSNLLSKKNSFEEVMEVSPFDNHLSSNQKKVDTSSKNIIVKSTNSGVKLNQVMPIGVQTPRTSRRNVDIWRKHVNILMAKARYPSINKIREGCYETYNGWPTREISRA